MQEEIKTNQELPYPVSMKQLNDLREDTLKYLYTRIFELDGTSTSEEEFLKVNAHIVITEVIYFYIADILLQMPNENFVKNFPYASSMRAGEVPPLSAYLINMAKGEPRESTFKKMGRIVKTRLQSEGVKYQPLFMNKKNQILTFSVSDLISANIKQSNVKPIRNVFSEWYSAEKLPDYNSNVLSSTFVSTFLEDIKRIAIKYGSLWGGQVEAHLKGRIEYMAFYTHYYLKQIQEKHEYIPETLWIGSAGQFPSRIMATVAKRHGRHVIGHDHGSGFGWLDSEYQTILDFNYIDEFITSSENMAQGLKDTIRKDLLFNTAFKPEDIKWLNTHSSSAVNVQKGLLEKKDAKILFVANAYLYGHETLYPWMFLDVATNWHSQLMKYLINEGFKVVFRPHPGDYYKDYSHITALGIEIDPVSSLIESCKNADLVMFDISTTTAVPEVLKTGNKIVILDSNQMGRPTHKTKEIFSKTLLHEEVEYDSGNRVIMPNRLAERIRRFHFYSDPNNNFLHYHSS